MFGSRKIKELEACVERTRVSREVWQKKCDELMAKISTLKEEKEIQRRDFTKTLNELNNFKHMLLKDGDNATILNKDLIEIYKRVKSKTIGENKCH